MSYNNIDEIVRFFELSTIEPEEIRRELRQRLKTVHPDATTGGGSFATSQDEQTFIKIIDALEFIDSLQRDNKSQQLVPLPPVYELLKVMQEGLSKPQQTELQRANDNLQHRVEKSSLEFNRRIRVRPISFTVASIILSFVWFFPKTISEHPVLKPLIQDAYYDHFSMLWVSLLVATVFVWVIALRQRDNYNRLIHDLSDGLFHAALLEGFTVWWLSEREHQTPFTLNDTARFIKLLAASPSHSQRQVNFEWRRASYREYIQILARADNELYLPLSELVLAYGIDKQVIQQSAKPTVYPEYLFNNEFESVFDLTNTRWYPLHWLNLVNLNHWLAPDLLTRIMDRFRYLKL